MASQRQNSCSAQDEVDDHGLSASELKDRIAELERMVILLLAASLRGRLLPADRKMIKSYLDVQAKQSRQSHSATPGPKGPICPVCRLPIADGELERCPNCSVLLDDVRKYDAGE